MECQSLTIYKKTGSLADATMATGLGVLLRDLAGEDPRLRDAGPYYEVSLQRPIDLDTLPYENLGRQPGYKYVKKTPNDPAAPADALDYGREQAQAKAAREAKKAARAKAKLLDGAEGGLDTVQAAPDWYLFQELNVLQAFGSHNLLHTAIREAPPEVLAASVRAKLEAAARGEDLALVETEFCPKVRPVQGFNPLVGKGVSRLKPDKAPVNSLGEEYADWFEEWLRYAGAQQVANASAVGEDIKMMALVPADIHLSRITGQVREDFLAAAGRVWTSSQLDIHCVLNVAKSLVKASGLDEGIPGWIIGPYFPNNFIAGVYTAYFKSLGTGRALSNLSFIALPGWFPITDAASARSWIDIIDEHLRIVTFLREDRSEEYALIVAYRDFLSGGDAEAFLRFAASYATYVMRGRESGRPVRQLTTTNLVKVVTSMDNAANSRPDSRPKLADLFESQGFRNIARAVRQATVTEQFHKSRGKQAYEIHYGLFHELRRVAGFRDQVLKTVSDLVGLYNAENARLAERSQGGRAPQRRRTQVTTADLEEFAGLLDRYPPEVVAYALIGYGSAREPREAEPGGESSTFDEGDLESEPESEAQ